MNGPYAAWKRPNYRLFACGWFLLVFSNQVATVALGIRLYDQTSDPLALGGVGLVQVLPVLLLAIPGGQLADRYPRKTVFLTMLGLGTLIAAGMAVATGLNASAGWLYLLIGASATAMALGNPSRTALLPQIVEPEVFNNAVTWTTTVFHLASMSGPAAGGLLMAVDPSACTAFSLVTALRILAVLAIAAVVCKPVQRNRESLSLNSLAAGVRFVFANKPILAAISLDLFAVLVGGLTYLLPIIAKDVLHVGSTGVGLLRSAEAVGAVSMAVLLAHLPPIRRAGPTMLYAVAGFGVATIVFGLSRWFALSLAMMFLIGALDNVSVVIRHTLVQMLTPDAMRGRVSAVNYIFIAASNDLGGFESGVTARLLGTVPAVVGGGIGTILVVLGAAGLWPELVAIGSLQDLRPMEEAPLSETSTVE